MRKGNHEPGRILVEGRGRRNPGLAVATQYSIDIRTFSHTRSPVRIQAGAVVRRTPAGAVVRHIQAEAEVHRIQAVGQVHRIRAAAELPMAAVEA